ncbi:MAG: HlyD family efflux transporter periplasmic adaptor subunit [Isosphaeraceae bacterium]
MSTEDATVRLIEPALGAMVKQRQEVVRLDSDDADAALKVAEARVKARDTASKASKDPLAAAELAVAQAEAGLAKLKADRRTLRAPFDGILLAVSADVGQFVAKGEPIVELGDISRLRALVPADRNSVQPGGTIALTVEGKPVNARVRAVVPLPETFSPLRELATPFAGAWVELDNPRGELQPGMRVRPPGLPVGPIASVAASAIREIPGRPGATVQVIRADYVQDLPAVVMGEVGPDRIQVSGPFRGGDAVIVSSSIPLAARTYVRFGGESAGNTESRTPNPEQGGSVAQVSVPGVQPGAAIVPGNPAVAPIGAPGSAAPGVAKGASAAPPPAKGASPTPGKPASKGNTPF